MAQFLYYYRMIGVVAFELTQNRTILFIFPNTFEYFFLFVELVRLGWNTDRMGKWDGDPQRGRHLDLHQAAAGVVDPHRPARHDGLHQGDAVRRGRHRQLEHGDRQSALGARRGDRLRRRPRRDRVLDHHAQGAQVRPQGAHRRRPAAAAAARRGAVPQGARRDEHLRLGAQGEGRAHGDRLRHLRPHAHRRRGEHGAHHRRRGDLHGGQRRGEPLDGDAAAAAGGGSPASS